MQQRRRSPQRTCVVCREVAAKRTLMRLVRTPEGTVVLDPRGKASGRGAYLCGSEECFTSKRAREAVARALQVSLGEDEWSALTDQLRELASERSSSAVGKDE
ncbi:MAG: YlxR family protein [Anaerolineae bacterium]|nr:YlxR family protein [Anaerolineae bacterium]